MIDTDQETLKTLRGCSITLCVGFYSIKGPTGVSTVTVDYRLMDLLKALGVPCTKISPEAGINRMEVGHEEL